MFVSEVVAAVAAAAAPVVDDADGFGALTGRWFGSFVVEVEAEVSGGGRLRLRDMVSPLGGLRRRWLCG